MKTDAQIAVIGGGLAGKAAAFAAARAGFETIHVAPEAPPDRRTSALMLPSVDFLEQSGLIENPSVLGVPLTQIRIIDATGRLLRAPETLFEASEFGEDAFGWNFANVKLGEAFEAAASQLANLKSVPATLEDAQHEDDGWVLTLSGGEQMAVNLLVGADGKGSRVRQLAGIEVREHKFRQSALVCDLELERPLEGCSVEFHYSNGPFTLVPAGGMRANLVWLDKVEVLQAAQSNREGLQAVLIEKSQRLFGNIEVVTPSFIFPLSDLGVDAAGKNAAVLVGEAAHAFPPIGAQGLNLGLRDVDCLAQCLATANPGAYGWADPVARHYAHARESDLRRTGLFVDTLFRSLISDMLPAQALRTAGLWALKAVPALKRGAMGFGMGR